MTSRQGNWQKITSRRGVFLCCVLLFLCPATVAVLDQPESFAPQPTESTDLLGQPAAFEDYGKTNRGPSKQVGATQLPLVFEVNRGQTDPQVKFLARGDGYTLFLTGDEVVMVLRSRKSGARSQEVESRGMSVASGQWQGDGTSKLETRNSAGQLRHPTPDTPLPLHQPRVPSRESRTSSPEFRDTDVLRMKFLGANRAARVTAFDKLPGTLNYFIGNNPRKWRTGVPTYGRVKYEGIYPGIDLIFYSRERQLEYDFVVSPGADPRAIALEVETGKWKLENGNSKFETRNSKITIDRSGNLAIQTCSGKFCFHKPIVYQLAGSSQLSVVSRPLQHATGHGPRTTDISNPKIQNLKSREGRYVLTADHRIQFEIPDYDKTRALVIDPVLSYSTYLGGSGSDYAYALAVDAAGSAYVTGYTNSPDFPLGSTATVTPGGGTCGFDLDAYPCFDVFVAKLNPAGTALVYTTYLGGSGDDVGKGIALDSAGNAYITGYTNSNNLFTSGAAQPISGGGTCGVSPTTYPCYDAFVAKLDSQGASLLYLTYLGGTSDDFGQGIAVDSTGNALVAGFTTSANFPATQGAVQRSFAGGVSDAFVTRVNPAGTAFLYSTYLGGSGEDQATKVRVDSAGAAYITGYTNSSDFPTRNAFQAAPGGGVCGPSSSPTSCFDAFVTKLNAEGSALLYATYLGGTGGDYGYGLAVDGAGSVYITGLTTSTDFPVSGKAFQARGGGNSVDAFVTKLDPAGSRALYSTYLGGLGAEAGLDIALDASCNAYVAGYAYGSGLPVVNPIQAANAGFYDAFLAEFNATGTALIFATYFGGSGNEKAHAVAVDPEGNIYLAGGTFSTDLHVTPGALQLLYGGGAFDAFVAKLGTSGQPAVNLSTTAVAFEDQGISTTSAPKTVTLTNAGNATVALGGVEVTGDFSQTNDCGLTLAPGATCTLHITFSPTAVGPRSGKILIRSDAEGSPHTVSLSGTGVVAFALSATANPVMVVKGMDAAELSLSASSAFGFSGAIALDCSVAAPAACATDPAAIWPGQSSKLTVRNLSLLAADSLSLTAMGTSGAQTASVALMVKITDFSLTASPAEATVTPGGATTYTLTLTPLNGFNQSVELKCSGQPEATNCSLVPSSATLTGASPSSATLTLHTTSRSFLPPRQFPWTSKPDGWQWLLLLLAGWHCIRVAGRRALPISRSLAPFLACLVLWSACGGGRGGNIAPPPPSTGTPPGTYTITVTGSYSASTGGNATTLSHQTTVKLTVN